MARIFLSAKLTVLSLLTGLIIFNLDSTPASSFSVVLMCQCLVFFSAEDVALSAYAFQFLFDVRVKPASLFTSCMLLVSVVSQPPNSQIPSNCRSIFVPFRDDLLFLGAHVVIFKCFGKIDYPRFA